jgi:hypothetical protein
MMTRMRRMGSVVLLGLLMTSGPLYATSIPNSITDTFVANNGVLTPSKITVGYTLSGTWTATLTKFGIPLVGTTVIKVSGFNSDPGQSWLNSLSCSGTYVDGSTSFPQSITLQQTNPTEIDVENGVTENFNIAPTYSFSGGTATWSWGISKNPGITGDASCSITYSGTSGVILPKFKVVGLTYAPPGSKSTATYSNGFQSGNSTSVAQSSTNSLTVTSKLNTGFSLFGFLSGAVTNTASANWTQEQDSNSSLNLQQQYTNGLQVPPPPLVSGVDQGVDHDYDTVYVWINPADLLVFTGNVVVSGGEYYDDRDGITPETCNGGTYAGVTGMDVVPLTIGNLRGTQPITDPCLLLRLSRPWDPVLGGLTVSDYAVIAAADPFYTNPSFNPNNDTSGRFDIPQDTASFAFVPGSATRTYSSMYTSTSTQGQSAKSTYSVSFTVAGQASASFFAKAGDNFSVSDKITYTNQSSSTVSSGTSQSMSYSVVPPAVGTYSGPTQIQVWKDNIYGTFMFFPEN